MSAEYRNLNEQALLAQCRWDAFRGPGPGGQKRNKTSSSVRLTHLPTQLHVIAGESRSQVENKLRAVRRLKMKLALEFRRPIDTRGWEPPPWLDQIRTRPAKDKHHPTSRDRKGAEPIDHSLTVEAHIGMRLQISHRHPVYYHFVGLLLDLLESRNGQVSDVADLLGLSTSSTIKFLASDPHLLTTANQIRTRNGQPPLNVRK